MFIFTVNIAFNILFKMSLCVVLFIYVYRIYDLCFHVIYCIFCCVRTAAEYLRAEAGLLCWIRKLLSLFHCGDCDSAVTLVCFSSMILTSVSFAHHP